MTEPPFIPTPKADHDRYHYVIPRFILRRFQVGGQMSKKERQKAFKRTGREPGEVLFYDLTARTIQTRPIATVYGVTNLYKDIRYPFDVNHLEERLSQLESNSADVILQMHEAVNKGGSFVITRKKLGDLSQFLFLMHYRTVALSVSDTNSDRPGNALVAEQLKRFGDSLALSTSSQTWLHFLHYFLDGQSTYDGATFTNREDLENYTHTEILPRNVDIPHIPATIYQRQAGMSYLAVCQPADNDEFVLTNNGLGSWEGLSEQCPIHRVFVVGPRLAIILRNNAVDSQASPQLRSALADIPLPCPTCLYVATSSDIPPWQDDHITSADEHRMSEQAQMDEFTFHITKLTSRQTFDVNSFLLRGEHDDGSITFTSKEFMMKTLEHYTDTASLLEDPHTNRYDSALSHLRSELYRSPSPSSQTEKGSRKGETCPEAGLSPSTVSTSSHSAATAAGPHASPPRSKRSKKSHPRVVQLARSGTGSLTPPLLAAPRPSGSSRVSASQDRNGPVARPVAESDISPYSDQHTEALDELMIQIITRQTSFFSSYEQAYRLYNLFVAVQPPAVHPFARDCDRLLLEITSRFQEILKPPNRGVRPRPNASSPVPHPRADQERWPFLVVLLDMLGLGNAKNPRNSWEEMCRGVVAVGLSTWMAKNRPDVLASLHFA